MEPNLTGQSKPIQDTAKPAYEKPTISVMDRDDVLQAFQMTAAQISAAGCWWTPGCAASPCKFD